MNLDKSQTSAVDHATGNRFSIITGGAGTGKTTIIKTITERLEAAGEKVTLCAFAGKAASRLREACKHPAYTIHRTLGYNGVGFAAGELTTDSLIIDESSMVSSDLMAEIVRRNPKRLVLVGDPAQLPPVGRGQPFHDLIQLRPETVVELSTCYRATEAVYQAANAIRNGARPPLSAASSGEKWNILNTGDDELTQAKLLEWIAAGSLDFEQDIILCPKNGESVDQPCTVSGLNRAIVEMIGQVREKPTEFKPGDRVINTKNLPQKDMWNGTTGTIHAIDMDGGIWISTDIPVIDWNRTEDEAEPVYTGKVLFSKAERIHLQHAYALTVHKSQGSQYRRVVFVALNRDSHMLLDRSLIYTAVTRTREQCVVVGNMQAFMTGIDKVQRKRTVLQELAAAV